MSRSWGVVAILLTTLCALAAPAVRAEPMPPPFEKVTPPPVPDYARPDSWAALPNHEGAAAALAPGATPQLADPKVDVFYINPTTYKDWTHWNQDAADRAANDWTDQSVVARQAGIFNGCCRVFVPRYRQASIISAHTILGEGMKGFDLAYGDVKRAFDYYLAHDNGGRPFILVAHSQGAFHLARLLGDEIDGKPLARRMVAAYDIGYVLADGDFGRTYKHLKPCDMPAQTGCVISWNSVTPAGATPAFRASLESHFVKLYGDVPGKTLLCINPLTFDQTRPNATRANSLGAAPGDPGWGPVRPLVAHEVSASCVQGLLIVQPDPSLGLKPLPNGFMHYHDFGMFYADIRANAALRVAAFLKAHRQER